MQQMDRTAILVETLVEANERQHGMMNVQEECFENLLTARNGSEKMFAARACRQRLAEHVALRASIRSVWYADYEKVYGRPPGEMMSKEK